MVGKVEPPLEGTRGDAAVKIGAALLLFAFRAPGGDEKRVLLHLDVEVVLGKARHGDRDAPGIVAGLLDVVGRVGRGGLSVGENPVHQVGNLIEADGCTVERCKIERAHVVILH